MHRGQQLPLQHRRLTTEAPNHAWRSSRHQRADPLGRSGVRDVVAKSSVVGTTGRRYRVWRRGLPTSDLEVVGPWGLFMSLVAPARAAGNATSRPVRWPRRPPTGLVAWRPPRVGLAAEPPQDTLRLGRGARESSALVLADEAAARPRARGALSTSTPTARVASRSASRAPWAVAGRPRRRQRDKPSTCARLSAGGEPVDRGGEEPRKERAGPTTGEHARHPTRGHATLGSGRDPPPTGGPAALWPRPTRWWPSCAATQQGPCSLTRVRPVPPSQSSSLWSASGLSITEPARAGKARR